MARAWLLVAALSAGVVAPDRAHARPPEPTLKSKAKTKSKSKAKGKSKSKVSAKAKSRSKSKSKSKSKLASRSRRSVRGDNMPRGFDWPPTPQMLAAERACEAALDDAGVSWHPAAPEGRIVDAITIPGMTLGGIVYANAWGSKRPYKMDCQLALALETVGAELHAIGVREVKFGSIYRWSNVRVGGKTKRYLSRHALGLAMDVVAFVDQDGRIANVKADYDNDDPLLLAVEHVINASGKFRLVLTPANDPVSHSDHFHIEAASDFSTPR